MNKATGTIGLDGSVIRFIDQVSDRTVGEIITVSADSLSSVSGISPQTAVEPGYIEQVPEIFADHELQLKGNEPVEFSGRTPDWFTVFLFLAIAGIAYVKFIYPKMFRQVFKALFNDVVSGQLIREDNTLIQRAAIGLSFVFYLTFALFLYQLSVYFAWDTPVISSGIVRYLLFILIIAFAYSLKLVVLKSLSWLFGFDRPFAHYMFIILLINNVLGILLVPVVLAVAFADSAVIRPSLITGIVMLLMAFMYRLFRGFFIWKGLRDVSVFYIILYFCTLEITPILVIVKLAVVSN